MTITSARYDTPTKPSKEASEKQLDKRTRADASFNTT